MKQRTLGSHEGKQDDTYPIMPSMGAVAHKFDCGKKCDQHLI